MSEVTADKAPATEPGQAGHVVDRSGPPLLEAEGIWKIFGPNPDRIIGTPDADLSRSELRKKSGTTVAVRDVSIQIWPGEVFVVMGLSGSGKSTLLRTLIRLIEPTAGDIKITGSDVMAADPAALRDLRRHTVAMVFQHFGLLAHRTVIENVAFGLEIQGAPKAERLARGRLRGQLRARHPAHPCAHAALDHAPPEAGRGVERHRARRDHQGQGR